MEKIIRPPSRDFPSWGQSMPDGRRGPLRLWPPESLARTNRDAHGAGARRDGYGSYARNFPVGPTSVGQKINPGKNFCPTYPWEAAHSNPSRAPGFLRSETTRIVSTTNGLGLLVTESFSAVA